jgi:hypothetical protein
MEPDPAFSMMRIEEEDVSTNRRAQPSMSQLSCEGGFYFIFVLSLLMCMLYSVLYFAYFSIDIPFRNSINITPD